MKISHQQTYPTEHTPHTTQCELFEFEEIWADVLFCFFPPFFHAFHLSAAVGSTIEGFFLLYVCFSQFYRIQEKVSKKNVVYGKLLTAERNQKQNTRTQNSTTNKHIRSASALSELSSQTAPNTLGGGGKEKQPPQHNLCSLQHTSPYRYATWQP